MRLSVGEQQRRINESKSWLFEKSNKINKASHQTRQENKQKTQKTQMTSIRNKIGVTINDPMIIIEMIKKYDEQIPWLA